MDKYLGKRLDGRYEIHQLLGSGGMANVYRAYDNKDKRWVAIKILKEEFSENSEFLKRFRNESRAIAVLSHPNIVKVYDVSFGDRIQYIVMEYIEGITLKEYISHNGALPWKEVVHFTTQILMALQHAHSNGIVHRDIKPQNIMLLQNGTIKVTDFGIARFSQSETQTVTDKALGSVHYIAPEQAKGEFTSDKADIYSVGVMMYEMLTGQLPFDADNAVSVAIMQLQVNPVNPRSINPKIPVGLEEITIKAMEKNPAMRFHSAAEMLSDIERFKQNPNLTFGYTFQQDFDATRQIDIYDDVRPASQNSKTQPTPVVYGDDYEYEVELEKSKKHARGSMIVTGIISAVVVAALCFGIYFVFTAFSGKEKVQDQVALPNFIGMNYETEIKGNAKYSDFKFVIVEAFDSEEEVGIVLKQSPNSGIEVKKGKEVTLTVNKEQKDEKVSIVLSDYEGEKQTDAYNSLLELELVPEVKVVEDDQTAAGYVISTEPAAGETVYTGDTVVIIVSKGTDEVQTTIPSIVGLPLYQAESLLEQSNLSVGEVTYDEDSDEEADTVISCSPKEDKKVDEGTSVDLVVAKGKKKDKTISATFNMPAGIDKDMELKIYLDGELITTTTINPSYSGAYETSFVGKEGAKDIVVALDGQVYIKATVDFDDEYINIDSIYEIEVDEPEPPENSDSEESEE